MSLYTKKDLVKFVSEPFELQYERIISKIVEAYNWTNGDMLICFSGGKDSALILDIWCDVVSNIFSSDKPIKVAFADTTNETANMRKYVPWFINRCETLYNVSIDFQVIKPLNHQNFITVLRSEGLPFVSKMVSATLRKVMVDFEKNGVSYSDVKDLHHPTLYCRDSLREMGLSDTTVLAFTGWSCRRGDFGKEFVLPALWLPLLDIKRVTGKNIRFTEKCCNILKKRAYFSIVIY